MKLVRQYILFFIFSTVFFLFTLFHPFFSFADYASCASIGQGTCINFSNNCVTSSCSSTNTETCTGTCSEGGFTCQISQSCASTTPQTCANQSVSCPGYTYDSCPGQELCTDRYSCGGTCYTPVCLANQSTETGCPPPSNGCIYEAFCNTNADPPTYQYPCQAVCPATPTPLPPTPTPTFCVPGSFLTSCTGRDGGCSSQGACEQSAQQCLADGSGYGPSYGQCSTSCTSCLGGGGGTPTPTPGPNPGPVCGGWCTSQSNCCNGAGCACDGVTNTCTVGSGPNDGYCSNSSDVQCCVTQNGGYQACGNGPFTDTFTVGNQCSVTITHLEYTNGKADTGNRTYDGGWTINDPTPYPTPVNSLGNRNVLVRSTDSCQDQADHTGCNSWQWCANGPNNCKPDNWSQDPYAVMNFNNNWSLPNASTLGVTTSIDLNTNPQGQTGAKHAGYQINIVPLVLGASCSINNCNTTQINQNTSLATQGAEGDHNACNQTWQTPETHNFSLHYCGNGICECGETNATCPADCGPSVTPIPTSTPTPTPTPIPLYSVSGNVFVDADSNGTYDNPPDTLYSSTVTIDISNGITSLSPITTSTGYYNFKNLPEGTYTVSLNPVPANYEATTPTSFLVTVGSNCSTFPPSTCDISGNVTGLNFGITNNIAWFQGTGGDMRMDDDFTDPIPTIPTNYVSISGTEGTPGVLFAGSSSSYDFCSGAGLGSQCPQNASSTPWDWLVAFQKLKATNSIPTYESVTSQNIQTPMSLPLDCDTTGGCSISHGYYQDTSSTGVTLDSLTLSSGTAVIAIKGDLYINGNINANGGTLIFLVGGKIYVGSNVGTTNNSDNTCSASNTANCQIQGFYVADSSFQINSATGTSGKCNTDGSPISNRLNILGAVVVNAYPAGIEGPGSFLQYRDLCNLDPKYPAVSIVEDPDMILNIPPFVSQPNNLWQEVAP